MGHGPSEIEPTLAKRASDVGRMLRDLSTRSCQRPIVNATSIDDEDDAHPSRVAAVRTG